MVLRLCKLESPSLKDDLCQVWLKLVQWVLEKKWKCEKFTDRQTDDMRTEKLIWPFSSGELKRKVFRNIVSVNQAKVKVCTAEMHASTTVRTVSCCMLPTQFLIDHFWKSVYIEIECISVLPNKASWSCETMLQTYLSFVDIPSALALMKKN